MPADSFESPLTLAACGGHVKLAALLIERGANIEEVNDEGYTPLMEAAREGHEEMVALLLAQGKLVLHLLYRLWWPCAVESHPYRNGNGTIYIYRKVHEEMIELYLHIICYYVLCCAMFS